ncbi:MAG: methyltransferase domain-containing protein [Anaerolineales bacterium]|jgi:tRNA (uracil-5-)-methyltransferase TRM9
MRDEIIDRLIRLNRGFYQTFAASFAETRARLQPGVLRILDDVNASDSILDLGCGNGELARTLARRGHRGVYYGLDSSQALLEIARTDRSHSRAHFIDSDLTESGWSRDLPSPFDRVFAFAVLHHIPGGALRKRILSDVHDLLTSDGKLIMSNWNFPESQRLRKRVLPWSTIGIAKADVDPGDALLDWKRGGRGLRYVHHFSEEELNQLAQAAGFRILDTFYSDGEGGRLGLYQVWEK